MLELLNDWREFISVVFCLCLNDYLGKKLVIFNS